MAHELGHFHIPSHNKESRSCHESDLRAQEGSAALQEWEANDFASELLMPARLFGADVYAREISVACAMELAKPEWYDVSVMAAARRIVQTTRQAAALVVSSNGRVSWAVRSDAFRIWLPASGDRLNHDTLAAAGHRGLELSERPLGVPIAAWMQRARDLDGELLESAYRIESQEQIVSLLWHVDGDAERDDD